MREWEERRRFHEMDSSDEHDHGVDLDNSFHSRFAGDELYYNSMDSSAHTLKDMRDSSFEDLAYGEEYAVYEEPEELAGSGYIMAPDHEDVFVERALDRIRHARANGKTNISLSLEEMDALERRTVSSKASTPVKAPQPKGRDSRSSSNSDQPKKSSRRSSRSSFFGLPQPSKSKSSTPKRKPVADSNGSPATHGAPGLLVSGSNGVPQYAPLGYRSTGAIRTTSSPSRAASRSSSRSASASRRSSQQHQQQLQQPAPPGYPSYPPVSGSFRSQSAQEDLDWHGRRRSSSLAQSYPDPFYYSNGQLPAAQQPYPPGRRVASGGHGPDVTYASLRRVPPGLGPTSRLPASASDPVLRRHESTQSSEENDDEDDQGVQVEVVPEAGSGGAYGIKETKSVVGSGSAVGTGNSKQSRTSGRRRKR